MVLGDCNGFMEAEFGFSVVVWGLLEQEVAFDAIEFRLISSLPGLVYQIQRLSKNGESFLNLSSHAMDFHQHGKTMGQVVLYARRPENVEPLSDQANPLVRLFLHRHPPPSTDGALCGILGKAMLVDEGKCNVGVFLREA